MASTEPGEEHSALVLIPRPLRDSNDLHRVQIYSDALYVKTEVLTGSKDYDFYGALPRGITLSQAKRRLAYKVPMSLLQQNIPRWLLALAKAMLEPHQLTTGSGICYEVLGPVGDWVLSTICLKEASLTEDHRLFLDFQPWKWYDRTCLAPISASLPVEVEILKELFALGYLESSSRPSMASDGLERQGDLGQCGHHYKRTRLYQLSSREERRWRGCYLSSRGMRIRWKVIFAELPKPLAFKWWARSLNGRRYRLAVEYPANSSNIFTQRHDNSRSSLKRHVEEMDTAALRNEDYDGRALHARLSLGDSKSPSMSYNSRPLLMDRENRLWPILVSRHAMNKPRRGLEATSVIPADSLRRNALSSGITNLRLEELHAISRSGLDRLRLIAEAKLSHQVDWFPLPEIDRRPDSALARLVWEYGGKTMSIYLDQHQADRWREGADSAESGQGLPTFRESKSTSSKTSLTLASCWLSFRRGLLEVSPGFWQCKAIPGNGTVKTTACNTMASTRKDSYFCVDRLWNSVATTNMHTLESIDSLTDDQQLFLALRKTLNRAQGSWWHRLSSWRTCTRLQLSKFTFLFDNSDLVKVPKEANKPKVEDICRGYEYLIHSPQMGLDEHMQIMAEIILHGIQVPDRGKGSKAVLQGIPKLRTPPGILKKQLNSGCGFYAIQGYCLMKILFWVGVMLSPGLAFIVVWLSLVGALDLQNAFVPITFLSGLTAIILGISMILGV